MYLDVSLFPRKQTTARGHHKYKYKHIVGSYIMFDCGGKHFLEITVCCGYLHVCYCPFMRNIHGICLIPLFGHNVIKP